MRESGSCGGRAFARLACLNCISEYLKEKLARRSIGYAIALPVRDRALIYSDGLTKLRLCQLQFRAERPDVDFMFHTKSMGNS